MRRISLIAAALVGVATVAWAASEQRIKSDTVIFGNKTNADKAIKFDLNNGATNPGLRGNDTTGNIEFTHDGTNWKKIGSGTGGAGGINVLADNPDFEAGISANWTNSGGSYTALSGAGTALNGIGAARFNASASGQYVRSDAYTVPVDLQSGSCLAMFRYKTTEATNKYRLRALDGDDDSLLAYVDLDQTNSIVITGAVGFQCPSSGTIKWELYSTGDAADIDFDDAHLGSDVRLVDVAQATLFGNAKWTGVASCSWTTGDTSAAFTDYPADTDCNNPTVSGQASAPSTKVPRIKFASLPPGTYLVVLNGLFSPENGTTTATIEHRLTDGTTRSGYATSVTTATSSTSPRSSSLQGIFTYASTQTNIEFRPVSLSSSNSNDPFLNADTTARDLEITVYRFPSGAEVGTRVDQLGWRVDATISGANPDLGVANVATYTGIENASLTLTNNSGNGVITAQIPCSSTNAPSGTTCSAGSESVGLSFNVPTAGDVLACATFTHRAAGNDGLTASHIRTTFQIVETPSNAQTISQEGKGKTQSGHDHSNTSGVAGANNFPHRNCGIFNFAAAGQKTLRLFYEQTVAGTNSSSTILADADASRGQIDIRWEVYPLNYLSGALPIFKGMVTSQSSTRERVERLSFAAAANEATVCGSSPCTAHAQSGSWVSSVTRGSAGVYTVNVASGTFSATPICTCTALTTSSGGGMCHVIRSSSTSTSLDVRTYANNLTPGDAAVQMICMGAN